MEKLIVLKLVDNKITKVTNLRHLDTIKYVSLSKFLLI